MKKIRKPTWRNNGWEKAEPLPPVIKIPKIKVK